jgi:hypothetical protein
MLYGSWKEAQDSEVAKFSLDPCVDKPITKRSNSMYHSPRSANIVIPSLLKKLCMLSLRTLSCEYPMCFNEGRHIIFHVMSVPQG